MRVIVHPLVPGLEVALVWEAKEPTEAMPNSSAGLIRSVNESDLGRWKIGPERAWVVALDNLMNAARRGRIVAGWYGADAKNGKLMIWQGSWLAASCILLPGLWQMASGTVQSKHLLAAIPHRDVLVILPDDEESREKTAPFVREAEQEGRKPISRRLVRILPGVDKPFYEQPPIEWADV